jgi:hypothetical protein
LALEGLIATLVWFDFTISSLVWFAKSIVKGVAWLIYCQWWVWLIDGLVDR